MHFSVSVKAWYALAKLLWVGAEALVTKHNEERKSPSPAAVDSYDSCVYDH